MACEICVGHFNAPHNKANIYHTTCLQEMTRKAITIPLTHPSEDTNLQELTRQAESVNQSKAFETKDSGERQKFSTGMERDTNTGKIRYDLVYMPMFKRWAELMTRGAVKYSPNNWMKASTQEELDRFKESAFRHFMTWYLDEDRTEDHSAAVFFNISGAEYVREKLGK